MKQDKAKKEHSWLLLNRMMRTATERQVELLLEQEKKGRRRATFLKRLHQRLTRLRATRERVALKKLNKSREN